MKSSLLDSVMEYSLTIGTGLAIGLFGRPKWGWYSVIGAALLAVASVVFKSEMFHFYVEQCKSRNTRPTITWYIGLSFLLNIFLIVVITFLVFIIRDFLTEPR